MAWLAQYPGSSAIERQAKKAISLQLALAAPLWLAVGATASAGLWLMNRWTSATNLEAALAPRAAPVAEAPMASLVEIIAEPIEEAAPEPIVRAVAEPVVQIFPKPVVIAAPEPAPKIAAKPVVLIEPEPVEIAIEPAKPDDLTRLVGIGPKVAAALTERGVTRYAHLAAWTAEDMAKFDADLKLLGRGTRDAWIAQAKRLASEG